MRDEHFAGAEYGITEPQSLLCTLQTGCASSLLCVREVMRHAKWTLVRESLRMDVAASARFRNVASHRRVTST